MKVLEWQDRQVQSKFEKVEEKERESSVVYLINMLSDEMDHPEIWDIFKASLELPNQGNLIDFSTYLDQLLSVTQPPKVIKILSVSKAVCIAYLGNPEFAHQILKKMSLEYTQCPLVTGALRRVEECCR